MEKIGSKENSAVDRQINKWLQSRLILASGSEFRKNQLADFGFADIESISDIPESVETKVSDEVQKYGGALPNHSEVFQGSDIARLIASAKVQYVIENKSEIDTESLIIGFDTNPITYDSKEASKPVDGRKFTNFEEAEEGIFGTLNIIRTGTKIREEKVEEYQQKVASHMDTQDQEEMLSAYNWSCNEGHIDIYTAVAASFPGNRDKIPAYSESVRLEIGAITGETSNDELESFTKEILSILGDQVLKVSGGIDYSNPDIINLLQITEINPIDKRVTARNSHYGGYSETALKTLLYTEAHNRNS